IRVLGINSPELATKHSAKQSDPKLVNQPLAVAAKQAAEAFFKGTQELQLSYDHQRKDRYGRHLAHVYNARGQSLAAKLLRDGLAFHVVLAPNDSDAGCLQQQEVLAREAGIGIWREPYWRARRADTLTLDDVGFLRIQGRVV